MTRFLHCEQQIFRQTCAPWQSDQNIRCGQTPYYTSVQFNASPGAQSAPKYSQNMTFIANLVCDVESSVHYFELVRKVVTMGHMTWLQASQ